MYNYFTFIEWINDMGEKQNFYGQSVQKGDPFEVDRIVR